MVEMSHEAIEVENTVGTCSVRVQPKKRHRSRQLSTFILSYAIFALEVKTNAKPSSVGIDKHSMFQTEQPPPRLSNVTLNEDTRSCSDYPWPKRAQDPQLSIFSHKQILSTKVQNFL
jgi:hypothetical protein